MKIAVVILNWNGKALLEQFLPSVLKYSHEAKIYVADNASTDGSIAYLEQSFPNVSIVKNDDNYGFAGGYNQALKKIDADIFCLLNNDVEVTSGWLSPIIKHFEDHPATAIIQPKILDFKQRDTFEYAGAAGGFIDKYGYPYCRGRLFDTLETDQGQYNDSAEIFWASGACFFIRAKDFEQLGGFDDDFFAHMEEIDLCWRAFNSNLKVHYVGASTVYHLGGGTLSNLNPKKTYLNFRNGLFALTKNASGNLLFIIFIRLILDGLAALRFLFLMQPKHVLAILKSHLNFYSMLPKLLNERAQINQRKNYYKINSIVWRYFALKRQSYNSL
ncbi:glycosyltransferase family 2 protein [Paucihalobacter sp.]|uniref:glycosyltransferase family 2 protein n=1 Tax=Paucihalobacter sp. TaxID=2850405 RepID=UPI002FE41FAC